MYALLRPSRTQPSRLAKSLLAFCLLLAALFLHGTTRPIERVQVGDMVKSRNPQTGKTEAKRVDRTYVRVAPQVVTLTFTDGVTHQTERFTCTPEHPFFVDGKGFVKAEDLGIGTSLVTRAGPALTLSATSWSALPASGAGLTPGGTPGGYRVYNLRVEDDHSYFVGTVHGGTCVHNADYPIKVLPGGEGDDLAQLADEYRGLNGLGERGGLLPYGVKTRNLAVFEHEEIINGVSYRQKTLFSSGGGRHAEEVGLGHFAGREHQIRRVYSEFHPCDIRRHDCWGQLNSKLPANAKIYYSDPYMGLGK